MIQHRNNCTIVHALTTLCGEYYPAYTHGDDPDCKNCVYRGNYGCTNVNVKVGLWRTGKKEK